MKPETDFDYSQVQTLIESIKSNSMGDWFDLPDSFPEDELARIKTVAARIAEKSDYLVCIGIGGSYLGARAVYEALDNEDNTKCKLLFAGNSLSSHELKKVLKKLEGKDFSLNVISKSGTTTEPAIAFRILKDALIKKYGAEEAKNRIVATTDPEAGALHDEAVKNGYERFEVPAGVGGRYSVLTPVGLFPLAVAGVDIDKLLAGARHCKETELKPESSKLIRYAFTRAKLYQEKGCDVEVLASFEPRLMYFNEWWKQLFGESEGKDNQGIFPASVIYSTDLHSLGQYMQEGRRDIFETFLKFPAEDGSLVVPDLEDDSDGLAYLEGKPLTEVSDKALEATIRAHETGGIPVLTIEIADDYLGKNINELSLGYLIFFFETACAMSAQLLGVNPFDQPGVEKYKTEMFHLLGKPGF